MYQVKYIKTILYDITFAIVAPVLNSSYGTINVTEGTNQSRIVMMSNSSVSAFPPFTSTWTLNNRAITDNATTTISHSIRFDPIRRAQAGTYRIVATNTAGNDNQSFILNVFRK